MTIHVKPHLEAVLKAQVDAGYFSDMEAALEAAVLALGTSTSDDGSDDGIPDDDLTWVKPHIEEAEAEAAAGLTLSRDEVFANIEKRLKSR